MIDDLDLDTISYYDSAVDYYATVINYDGMKYKFVYCDGYRSVTSFSIHSTTSSSGKPLKSWNFNKFVRYSLHGLFETIKKSITATYVLNKIYDVLCAFDKSIKSGSVLIKPGY